MNFNSFINDINSWEEFQSKLSRLNKKQKGDAFENLVKYYLKVKPQYQDLYDEVWISNEIPQKVLKHLNLKQQDLGFDIIARSNKEYHAFQCKYHSDKSKSVTYKELSTFIALYESKSKISQGYVCSSANGFSKNIGKVSSKPIQYILADTWQNDIDELIGNIKNYLNKKKYLPTPFKPRPHQVKAITNSKKHFLKENNSRGKLIFPCGAGKSLTGFWFTQELKSKNTLIAVPSLALIKQTLDVYLREIVANNKKVKWLCICSDEGIGRNDDIVFKTENLGVPCKTDPDYIEKWLIENKNKQKIIFTTYQSGRIIAEVSKKLKLKFDVGIFDEAHKTVGSSKKLFSHLLFENNISIDKRIFMTATERFYAGSKDDILSMDDDDMYGDTFSLMSFKEAIELDLLTDYKVVTIDVKKSEISDFIKDNKLVQLNSKWKKEIEARSLASMLALRKAMKKFSIKNAVSFHSSIDKAKRNKDLQDYITETYNYRSIETFTVSGKIPTTKRNDIVQEFAKSDKALITNSRCLTEGIDVPNIDCIVFADPRRSKVDIVQALGRALRKKEGKDWGYVILPVVYDEKNNEIDNDNFNDILSIVRGLAANDERIVDYFKDKESERLEKSKKGENVFNFEVYSDYIDERDLKDNLQIKLWDKLSKFNWLPFEEARKHVRSLGLESRKEWTAYCKSGKKPNNIPTKPNNTYKNKGWIHYNNWIGTSEFPSRSIDYIDFNEARKFVHKLKLSGQKEWIAYCRSGKKPGNIPLHPERYYKKNGWVGLGDWLGTGRLATVDRNYLPFNEARDFVRKLKLKNHAEWTAYCKSGKKPLNIPTGIRHVYKDNGWQGWGDFLGTGNIGRSANYLSFNEARDFARKLKLKKLIEWKEYCKSGKKPLNIPVNVNKVYKEKGWSGWDDFLGYVKLKYLFFNEARDFVRKLKLKNYGEWIAYCKSGNKPDNIPVTADRVYKHKGWISFSDWIGTKSGWNGSYLKFENARAFVKKLHLQSGTEWNNYCKSGKKPLNIPAQPSSKYRNTGWVSMGDWLGTGIIAPQLRQYKKFEDAKEFVRKLKLKNYGEWIAYCQSGKKPIDIPGKPQNSYKNKGWKNLGDWLGTGAISSHKRTHLTYNEACKYVRKLNLKGQREWKSFCNSDKKPDNIPKAPQKVYKNKGWKGWGDFLGTGNISTKNIEFKSYNEAKIFAKTLGLKSKTQWENWCKEGKRPPYIPSNPQSKYKGWKGWKDFLGKE